MKRFVLTFKSGKKVYLIQEEFDHVVRLINELKGQSVSNSFQMFSTEKDKQYKLINVFDISCVEEIKWWEKILNKLFN